MRQILFEIPILGIPIYAYGFMAMCGLLAAIYYSTRVAKKEGIDPNHFFDLGLVALVSGIIGARILYVIQPNDILDKKFSGAIFNVFDGNMSVVGLAAGILVGGNLYFFRKKIRWLKFVHEKGPRAYAFFSIVTVLLALIIGRTVYCFANPGAYDLRVFEIWQGGLVWYGGLILGFICSFIFVLWRRLPIGKMMDIGAPAIMLGLAFGRIGCFLNGCCWGKYTHSPLFSWCRFPEGSPAWYQHITPLPFPKGVYPADVFPNIPHEILCDRGIYPHGSMNLIPWDAKYSMSVIPTQLMDMAFCLCIFVLLIIIYRHRKRAGQVMLALGFMYPALRFVVEMCRSDNQEVAFAFTLSQSISLGIIAVSLAAFLILQFAAKPVPATAEIPPDKNGPPKKKKK